MGLVVGMCREPTSGAEVSDPSITRNPQNSICGSFLPHSLWFLPPSVMAGMYKDHPLVNFWGYDLQILGK